MRRSDRNQWTTRAKFNIFNQMVKYQENELDDIFRALADSTRRGILVQLEQGEKTVLELAEPYEMSLPAVSKHLKVLERAKLIRRKVNGRVHKITANPEQIKTAFEWLKYHQDFWMNNFNNLKTLLESEDEI